MDDLDSMTPIESAYELLNPDGPIDAPVANGLVDLKQWCPGEAGVVKVSASVSLKPGFGDNG